VIVRLDAFDVERLEEILRDAWDATPLTTKLGRKI
jgi:hypothetical protein